MFIGLEEHEFPSCGCGTVSLDSYCEDFDNSSSELDGIDESTPDEKRFSAGPILATRRMMHVLIGCNQHYGYDGHIYDDEGHDIGEECLTLNQTLPTECCDARQLGLSWVYLSSFRKFNVDDSTWSGGISSSSFHGSLLAIILVN